MNLKFKTSSDITAAFNMECLQTEGRQHRQSPDEALG